MAMPWGSRKSVPGDGVRSLPAKESMAAGGVEEVLINAGTALRLLEFLNQFAVPACAATEILVVDKQRNGIKPIKEVVPLMGIGFKLLKSVSDQPVVTGIMFTSPRLAAASSGSSAITQGVILMITHHDAGGAPLNHIPHQVKGFTDSGATINDIPDEYHLPAAMLIHPIHLAVTHLLQQSCQRIRAAVYMTNKSAITNLQWVEQAMIDSLLFPLAAEFVYGKWHKNAGLWGESAGF